MEVEDRIVAAVLAVPGVAAMHGGTFGEAATYLPGRRVSGVRITDQGTDVHVTVRYGSVVREVAEQVRRTVTTVSPGPVQVTVGDLVSTTEPDDRAMSTGYPVGGAPSGGAAGCGPRPPLGRGW